MSVNRITAHIHHYEECIHWRDSLIGRDTLNLVVPEYSLYHLHISFFMFFFFLFFSFCTTEARFCKIEKFIDF